MRKENRPRFTKSLIEPTLYKAFARFLTGLVVGLLWNRFVNTLFPPTYVFGIVSGLYFLFTWMAYLRLDGVRIPKLERRLFDLKKKPVIRYGDMSDYVDEERDPYEGLEEEEKELCTLVADAICALIFLVISFF